MTIIDYSETNLLERFPNSIGLRRNENAVLLECALDDDAESRIYRTQCEPVCISPDHKIIIMSRVLGQNLTTLTCHYFTHIYNISCNASYRCGYA